MTERIYYTDAYLREFDAGVLELVTSDGRQAAILDRTAFYPTSGGQPHDTGTLGDARVVDVFDRDDGVVLHVIEGPIAPGRTHGRIDWGRRFEHMQQHTGQHVLSAAFERTCRVSTVSFHLGTASATIDLAREVSPREIGEAELAANRIVWEDRPVLVRFVEAAAAASLGLRKEPSRAGTLRIVEVEGFDTSACGGTHVDRTGAIGNIAVAGWERFRGGTRVEFRCGIRTLQAYRSLREAAAASAGLLSTRADDLPAAIQRLLSENRDGRRRLKDLQDRVARHEADALASRATQVGDTRVVVEPLDGWELPALKTIASSIAERPAYAAILISGPRPASIVAARGTAAALDCGALVKAVAARFGGKGGGRPESAQGGGLDALPADIAAYARTLTSSGA